ncbi:uncharacterized protein LOC130744206 [Lotus japonicus]|uniref:uncharacterized protein LOC130744206 n=1 Tax=Lotus japonicus TaxID=34305 RepID=UPI00258CA448|nr:uncharacterized protein LOC130744206 [Lotus japonicus]
MYNLPSVDEVADLIVGDFDCSGCGRDIILRTHGGSFQRITEDHASFLPLQYPLIFPYGEDGYSDNIKFRSTTDDEISRKTKHISLRELSFLRYNQDTIRNHFLSGIEEAIGRGDTNSSTIGQRIILPASFIGGLRYMFNNYIACRVFHMKLDQIMADFKKGNFFGKVIAGMYTIEFQKRGLPRAHILLWLHDDDKLNSLEMIDFVISAELPDPILYPKLYGVVSNYMVHGPCGVSGNQSPCMKNGRCSKLFPKKYEAVTSFDSDGYPVYRRRNTGVTTTRRGVQLDNQFVVPYNPKLLIKYRAHIDIKYYNKSNSIKYLFKYINKGVDRVTMSMAVGGIRSREKCDVDVDEIKQYYDCRYLSPCDSVVIFNDDELIEDVLARNKGKAIMFITWMEENKKYIEGKMLKYDEYLESFVYEDDKKEWRPRKSGFSIGIINFVPPGMLSDDREFIGWLRELSIIASGRL